MVSTNPIYYNDRQNLPCAQRLTEYQNKTTSMQAEAKEHPPSLHSFSLPMRETHGGRGEKKNSVSLFGCTQSTLSIWQRMWNHRKGEWRKEGKVLLKKMMHGLQALQLMSRQCTVGVFGGVFRRGCVSKGNKSSRIPEMWTDSQVSHS